jgi:V4R domain
MQPTHPTLWLFGSPAGFSSLQADLASLRGALALPAGALPARFSPGAEAALIFLVGGLAVLFGLVVLVLLQSLLPGSSASLARAPAPRGRELRPLKDAPEPELELAPRTRDGAVEQPAIDHAMDRAVEAGIGEPRILRSVGNFTQVRLYACAACQDSKAQSGCPASRDALEACFRTVYGPGVRTRETSCRTQGNPHCEFEVRH